MEQVTNLAVPRSKARASKKILFPVAAPREGPPEASCRQTDFGSQRFTDRQVEQHPMTEGYYGHIAIQKILGILL